MVTAELRTRKKEKIYVKLKNWKGNGKNEDESQ
jgi:hypothetical protein